MGETAVELIQDGKDITEYLTDVEKFQLDKCEQVIKKGLNTFLEVGSALADIRDNRLYRDTYKTWDKYCKDRWDIGKRYADRQIRAFNTVTLLESKMGTIVPKNESSCDEKQAELAEKCLSCEHRKGMANRAHKGVRIPWGHGKCTRPEGLCEAEPQPEEPGQAEIILPVNEAQAKPLTDLPPAAQVEAWQLVLEQLNQGKKLTSGLVSKMAKQVKGETAKRKINTTKKKINSTELVSNLFRRQYQVMLDIISEERNSGWKDSSRKEAVKWLKNLVKIAESEN